LAEGNNAEAIAVVGLWGIAVKIQAIGPNRNGKEK